MAPSAIATTDKTPQSVWSDRPRSVELCPCGVAGGLASKMAPAASKQEIAVTLTTGYFPKGLILKTYA
jgi:hypothetical protein